MTQLAILQQHHALCDEIYQCVLEENHFLRQHSRAPEQAFLDRKRDLLQRLDQSLEALRTFPAASARDPQTQAQLEKSRARILQILQLDKENEQLLLRCSLTGGRPAATAPTASVTMLQKIYARCS